MTAQAMGCCLGRDSAPAAGGGGGVPWQFWVGVAVQDELARARAFELARVRYDRRAMFMEDLMADFQRDAEPGGWNEQFESLEVAAWRPHHGAWPMAVHRP